MSFLLSHLVGHCGGGGGGGGSAATTHASIADLFLWWNLWFGKRLSISCENNNKNESIALKTNTEHSKTSINSFCKRWWYTFQWKPFRMRTISEMNDHKTDDSNTDESKEFNSNGPSWHQISIYLTKSKFEILIWGTAPTRNLASAETNLCKHMFLVRNVRRNCRDRHCLCKQTHDKIFKWHLK